ncbi:hypothetical protein Bca4012_083321 [Brassica carinata]
MGANLVLSDATLDLDEQISQHVQCKPLSEKQDIAVSPKAKEILMDESNIQSFSVLGMVRSISLAEMHNGSNTSRTPNKENPTIGSSFAQDRLHPGAAMTTEERAGVTTQKEFVNVKRIIVFSRVSDVSIEPKAVLKLEQRATLPLSMMEIKLLKTQKLPEGKENNSKTIASRSKFGGQVSYGGEHKGGVNCVRMKSVVESENETVTVVNSNDGEDGSFFTFRTVSATCKAHCKACSTDITS